MSDLSKISDEELMKIANIQNVSDDELMKIAGVDQPQQDKSVLPFNPPRKAVIGAEGFNKGLANMLGMPVDFINTAISSIASLFGVTPSDKPVGGSEWMKEKNLSPSDHKTGRIG